MNDIDIAQAFRAKPFRLGAETQKTLWERMPMRKEVKLGFAIGGVVLAVVIVWILSVGGSSKPKEIAGAGGKATDAAKAITPSSDSLNNSKPVVAADAPAPAEPVATNDAPRTGAQPTTAPSSETASADKPKSGGDLDWGKLLNGDQQIPLIAQTPAPAPSNAASVSGDQAKTAELTTPPTNAPDARPSAAPQFAAGIPDSSTPNPVPTATAIETVATNPPLNIDPAPVSPTTRPAVASARTHVVQKGENLSTIAAAAYGSANYYPHILRANPNLDPKKLKVGMTINLPDITDVKPHDVPGGSEANQSTATPAAGRTPAAVDSTKEYKVQANDSLYKISIKLYGKSDMANKIYELNKEKIGPDSAKVKVGMVLKLPSAPTVTTTTAH
jgi:nucleoid-associated protein YgaU